jgi:hypothetical protein
VISILFFFLIPVILIPAAAYGELTYYAKIENSIVTTVIVADHKIIKNYPGEWVETFIDKRDNKKYAGIGDSYDTDKKEFKEKKTSVILIPADTVPIPVVNNVTNVTVTIGNVTSTTDTGSPMDQLIKWFEGLFG